MLVNLAEALRVVAILTKPFLPKTSETFYSAFNFGGVARPGTLSVTTPRRRPPPARGARPGDDRAALERQAHPSLPQDRPQGGRLNANRACAPPARGPHFRRPPLPVFASVRRDRQGSRHDPQRPGTPEWRELPATAEFLEFPSGPYRASNLEDRQRNSDLCGTPGAMFRHDDCQQELLTHIRPTIHREERLSKLTRLADRPQVGEVRFFSRVSKPGACSVTTAQPRHSVDLGGTRRLSRSTSRDRQETPGSVTRPGPFVLRNDDDEQRDRTRCHHMRPPNSSPGSSGPNRGSWASRSSGWWPRWSSTRSRPTAATETGPGLTDRRQLSAASASTTTQLSRTGAFSLAEQVSWVPGARGQGGRRSAALASRVRPSGGNGLGCGRVVVTLEPRSAYSTNGSWRCSVPPIPTCLRSGW